MRRQLRLLQMVVLLAWSCPAPCKQSPAAGNRAVAATLMSRELQAAAPNNVPLQAPSTALLSCTHCTQPLLQGHTRRQPAHAASRVSNRLMWPQSACKKLAAAAPGLSRWFKNSSLQRPGAPQHAESTATRTDGPTAAGTRGCWLGRPCCETWKLLCCETLPAPGNGPTAILKRSRAFDASLGCCWEPRGQVSLLSPSGSSPVWCSPERRGRVDIISRDNHILNTLSAAAPECTSARLYLLVLTYETELPNALHLKGVLPLNSIGSEAFPGPGGRELAAGQTCYY